MNNSVSLDKYRKEHAWGLLATINLSGCSKSKLKSPSAFQSFIVGLVKEIGMKRHGKLKIDRFGEGKLFGYSCFQFIETSSITCHFDDKKGLAFIDIFSCRHFDSAKAQSFCKKFFKAKKVLTNNLLRF